jgi:uncharacterized protein involved in exopolysaccharide biosynthesis
LTFATGFILWATPLYEGVAQVQMTQMYSSGLNPVGSNVEEPSLLIARFNLPSTYSDIEVRECGLEGQPQAKETLANNLVKISNLKGLAIVELKVKHQSPKQVKTCIDAIFRLIQVTQSDVKAPFLELAHQKMSRYQKQLQSIGKRLNVTDQSGNFLSASYISTRDEVNFLRGAISDLQDFIDSTEAKKARLISPLYVNNIAVFPNKRLTLSAGLIAGLFFGILFAVGRKLIRTRLLNH